MLFRRPLAVYRAPLRVDFFYDTLSPYCWAAFEVLVRYRPVWNLDLRLKPVFMGNVFQGSSNNFVESLIGSPSKTSYFFQDVERIGKLYQVPIRTPESPFYLLGVAGSLRQQRFLTAVKLYHEEHLEITSRELWYRVWSEDSNITKDSSLLMVALRAGLSDEEALNCLELSNSKEVMEELDSTTNEALKKESAFGVPWIVVKTKAGKKSEPFFGCDRFTSMANTYNLEWKGPVPDPDSFTPLELAPDKEKIFLDAAEFDRLNQDVVASLKNGDKEK